MSAAQLEKILVSGDVNGNFDLLFKRVSSANKKNGPFSMLLCVGDFFGPSNEQWVSYKERKLKAPILTFVLGPNSLELKKNFTDDRGCELAENIIYLGPAGMYPCSSGLRIAYLSGKESAPKGTSYGRDEVLSIENAVGKKPDVDILLSSDWPKDICNYAAKPNVEAGHVESEMLSRLVHSLKPRYLFAGSSGTHYERLPYRNHRVLKEPSRHVTRFISLAKVGNPEKHKWLYAFNVTPMVNMDKSELVTQPPDATECPFSEELLKKTFSTDKKDDGAQFFYDMEAAEAERLKGKRKADGDQPREKRKPSKPAGPCWFCLSSPEVEKHLVVSVGTYCYLALAKGGLVKTHLLIMPIEHFQSTPDLEAECREEISRFKVALQKMCQSIDHTVVFFERNYRTSHLQIQAVPIPTRVSDALLDTFMILGEELGCPLDEIPKHSELSQLAPSGTPFFYVELPTGVRLFHRIKKAFPIQFGREALASPELLNMSERIDWRECKITKEEETTLRDRIRTAFKPFKEKQANARIKFRNDLF